MESIMINSLALYLEQINHSIFKEKHHLYSSK